MEHGEDAAGGALEVIRLGRNAGLAEDSLLIGACLEGLEGMGLGAVVEEIGVRHARVAAVGAVRGDGNEARAAGNGYRLKERGVDDREHHGVEANAEGEGDDDGQGEPPMGEDHAQGEAQVVGHGGWYAGGGAMVPEL